MALLACHMAKFKQVDLKGMEIHNDRKSLHSSNKDIDYSRTSTNFDALTGTEGNPQINYLRIAKAIIEKKYTGTRALRSDAVYAVSFIVTAKNEFFANMSNDEQKRFFRVASDYLSEKFGSDNIIAAKVHRDEATPHMHFSFVPMQDGKLTAKTIVNRKALREVQDDLPKKLRSAGFDIERGVLESENEHVDPAQYKRNLAIAQKEVADIKKEINRIESEATPKKGIFDRTPIVKLPVEDYKILMEVAKDYAALKVENKKLEFNQSENVPKLHNEIKALEGKLVRTQEALIETTQQLEQAKRKISDQQDTIRYYNLLKKYAPNELSGTSTLAFRRQREALEKKREEEYLTRNPSARKKAKTIDDLGR